jgi:hypothetical protein
MYHVDVYLDLVNPVNPVHFLVFIGVYRRSSAFIGG